MNLVQCTLKTSDSRLKLDCWDVLEARVQAMPRLRAKQNSTAIEAVLVCPAFLIIDFTALQNSRLIHQYEYDRFWRAISYETLASGPLSKSALVKDYIRELQILSVRKAMGPLCSFNDKAEVRKFLSIPIKDLRGGGTSSSQQLK